jgi:hypothetical protein
MTILAIPLSCLHQAWPQLAPLLAPAVKRSADRPDLVARLLAQEAQLWAIYDDGQPIAAVVTMIQQSPGHPEGRRCLLWLVGGSRLRQWAAEFLAKVEAWARGLGCVALWGCGRVGWARIAPLFGGVRIADFDNQPAWEMRL